MKAREQRQLWEQLCQTARASEQLARASEATLRSALRDGASPVRVSVLEDQVAFLWHQADWARAEEVKFLREHF